MPATIRINRADVAAPVHRADVCVVGSGAAGLSAALSARRLGLSVILLDAASTLGGQAVGSAIGTICGLYGNGEHPGRLTHGVMDDMVAALIHNGAAAPRRARNTVIIDYEINAWQRCGETRIAEAGIIPLAGVTITDTIVETDSQSGAITRLQALSRFGPLSVTAKWYIDASGDAVLPWLAGNTLQTSDEHILGTTMAVIEGIDTAACADWARSKYHGAIAAHGREFGLVRSDGFVFITGPGRANINLTHIETPMTADGLTLAGFEGRRQVDAVVALFKRQFPAEWGQARVAAYGQPGLRQTRMIDALGRLTLADIRQGRRHDDAIARCSWPIELHTEMAATYWELFDDEHVNTVPLSSMLPRYLSNVIAAGRCIDAEPAALAAVRVMGCCFAMGRAAATGIALAQDRKLSSLHALTDGPAFDELAGALADNLSGQTMDPWITALR